MADKFSISIGPGNTIGAMAFGPGAKSEGSVSVGGAEKRCGARYRLNVEIRGATSRRNLATMLETIADRVRDGDSAAASGDVSSGEALGFAWNVEVES